MPETHCNAPECNNKSFPDISSLRKHQWAAHPERFAHLSELSKKRKEEIKKIKALGQKLDAKEASKELEIDKAEARRLYQLKYRQKMKRLNKKLKNQAQINISNGHVTVEQLLESLKNKRDFMNDIVDLIEGMLHNK